MKPATDQLKLPLRDISMHGGSASCAKCGRVFTSPNQYRFNSKGEPICRKFCREK